LTLAGEVVQTLFIAKEGNNIFTGENIAQMRSIEDRILLHPNFSSYCLRSDTSGQRTDCKAPLSPLNMLYAPQVDIKARVNQLDAMDGSVDGKLDVLLAPGLTRQLNSIRPAFSAIAQNAANHACASDAANPQGLMTNFTFLSCAVEAAGASVGLNSTHTAVGVYKVMQPIVMAFSMPRASTLQDVPSTLKLASYMKVVGFYQPVVDYYFDKGFSISNPIAKYSRGSIGFGRPLVGFKNRDDRSDEQSKELGDWFDKEFSKFLKDTKSVGSVEVLFFATPLVREEFLGIVLMDSLRVLASLALVFVWIWLQTNSIVIALAGIVEIMLSIPLAFFFYYVVFAFKYFDGLNAMTLFVVVAIGADDIFVFMDQYKQSAHHKEVCADLKTRMNWVYARASWAMFITSATTCAAFVCTAVNPLPNIQSFGIFSAFVIVADYVLVITWFPACVVLYHNYLESRPCCLLCCRYKEMLPCSLEMVTSTSKVASLGPEEAPQKRMIERAISGPFASLIGRFAPFIVIVFLALLIPAWILAAGIQPLSRSEEALPADHPFQRIWTVSGEQFPSSAQTPNTKVHVVWGVDGVDTSGVSLLRDGAKQKGKLLWDGGFQFDEAAQRHIWNVCEEVRLMQAPGLTAFLSRDPDADNAGYIECPLFDWRSYLLRTGNTFPLPLSQVPSVMPGFLESAVMDRYGRNGTMRKAWEEHLGYDAAQRRVRTVMITVESQMQARASHAPDELRTHYDRFEAWISEVNSKTGRLPAPTSASKAFHTSDGEFNGPKWVWMNTQSIFKKSAIQGAVIGTILAFVVILLATQQIIIALASFLSIASILASVLAMMKLAGYELGSTTSICITILAGFAVDYVVHLAHAYNHSGKAARADKFQEAFDDIGVSVLSGMVTSVVAAIVLLTCSLQFFATFGFFLLFTVLWAWVWGNLFFMSLMRLIGPDQSTPWPLRLPHSVMPAWPSCFKSTASEPARGEAV